jgi:hypothetical protein
MAAQSLRLDLRQVGGHLSALMALIAQWTCLDDTAANESAPAILYPDGRVVEPMGRLFESEGRWREAMRKERAKKDAAHNIDGGKR